jgi:hypothetical protein
MPTKVSLLNGEEQFKGPNSEAFDIMLKHTFLGKGHLSPEVYIRLQKEGCENYAFNYQTDFRTSKANPRPVNNYPYCAAQRAKFEKEERAKQSAKSESSNDPEILRQKIKELEAKNKTLQSSNKALQSKNKALRSLASQSCAMPNQPENSVKQQAGLAPSRVGELPSIPPDAMPEAQSAK